MSTVSTLPTTSYNCSPRKTAGPRPPVTRSTRPRNAALLLDMETTPARSINSLTDRAVDKWPRPQNDPAGAARLRSDTAAGVSW